MTAYLRKHWFLLLVLAGISACVVWPDQIRPWTDWLNPSYCGALAVLLSAWGMETRSLRDAVARPQAALWAVALSYGLVPALAWLAGLFMPESFREFRVGLLLIASVPCTLASAVIWTRLAGGNEAVALLVTLLTNCTSWLATTAWLTLGTGTAVGSGAGPMMLRLLVVLVAPVAVGQAMRLAGPLRRLAVRQRLLLGVVARLLILGIMLKAAVEVRGQLNRTADALRPAPLVGMAALCLALHLVALGVGLWSSKALGFDRASAIAVGIAGSQKTLQVALILFDAYFRDYSLAVIPLVFYHFGQLVADTFIAERMAGHPVKATEPPAEELV